ncbi:hypothetical protein H6G76_23295 [Nostoc sp. FACHB-152]|uniref:hypothetical protein n=1 Tax=unclassified Nostoc TaxID=2593658 RepID=UPI001683C529|nr:MULTISPECIES: hypothetical protein [unclassified Nostoc]MBD2450034.1 hypothetical protein [Nostoc sp. FACHB-152]MBD2470154.1 hypothetical protein [Nostoc sp. FACHB-145]
MNINLINSTILRQFWSVVEQTQSSTLLGLNDTDLVKLLLRQIESKTTLNHEETSNLTAYIYSKTLLIRDLAQI